MAHDAICLIQDFPDKIIDEKIRSAVDVLVVGVTLQRSRRVHETAFKRMKGSLRVLTIHKSFPAFSPMAEHDPDNSDPVKVNSTWETSLNAFKKLEPQKGLQIRYTKVPLSYGGIIIDLMKPTSSLFLWFYPGRIHGRFPKVVIHSGDPWCDYFSRDLVELWDEAKTDVETVV